MFQPHSRQTATSRDRALGRAARQLCATTSVLMLLMVSAAPAWADKVTLDFFFASSTLGGWPLANMDDGDLSTAWSSTGHGSPSEEWFAMVFPSQFVNYVELAPRTDGGGVERCLPQQVTLYYWDLGLDDYVQLMTVTLPATIPKHG